MRGSELYSRLVLNVFGQFAEATDWRDERGFRGSKTVLKLGCQGTCLGCSQLDHRNATLSAFSDQMIRNKIFDMMDLHDYGYICI